MRFCKEPGCRTILSTYNDEDRCFVHVLPKWGPNVHGYLRKRRAEELEGKHPEDLSHIDFDRETWAS